MPTVKQWIMGVVLPALIAATVIGLTTWGSETAITASVEKSPWILPMVTGAISAVIFAYVGYLAVLPKIKV